LAHCEAERKGDTVSSRGARPSEGRQGAYQEWCEFDNKVVVRVFVDAFGFFEQFEEFWRHQLADVFEAFERGGAHFLLVVVQVHNVNGHVCVQLIQEVVDQ
jgi:hypothetical protein